MAIGRCHGCGREWTGESACHCAGGCHRQFGSVSAFDRHRVGDYATGRRCMTDEELSTPRPRSGKPTLVAVERSGGLVWVTSVREEVFP